MKITGVEVTPISLEWGKKVRVVFGVHGKQEGDVIIQIFTDDGVSGLGEAMTLGPYYSKESQGTVMSLIAEVIAPQILIGEDPFNIDLIHHKMHAAVSENSLAKTAVDIALHDIVAKALKVPLYKLIGGKHTDKIALHWAIGIGTTEEMIAEGFRGLKAGYKALKVKVGGNPEEDVLHVSEIRKAVGPDIPMTIDFNMAYDVKTAIRVIRKMEQYDLLRVEQPVYYRDLDGMAAVRRAVETPIGACESVLTMYDLLEVIKKEAADFLNFKIMRSGGFYPGKAMVQVAEANGMFISGSQQLGMGIEAAAATHFAASTIAVGAPPHHRLGIGAGMLNVFRAVDSKGVTKDIVSGAPVIADGFITVPQASGLGIELIPENLDFYLTKGKNKILVGSKS